jgi:GNAT superfamily N-acetyltransferase
MPLVIRPAVAEDHDALLEQFLGLNVYEDAISHDRRTDHAGAVESLAAAWKRVTDTQGIVLVAVLDGQVAGHLFLTFENAAVLVREEMRPYAYVAELFVREAARGTGAGAALIAHAEALAASRGSRQMRIGVLSGNDGAERLYRRLGFAPHALELKKAISGPVRTG